MKITFDNSSIFIGLRWDDESYLRTKLLTDPGFPKLGIKRNFQLCIIPMLCISWTATLSYR